jgi:hypothetical protein
MSSGSYSSYSSSEATKEPETDDIDEACLTETPEMIDRVEKVIINFIIKMPCSLENLFIITLPSF